MAYEEEALASIPLLKLDWKFVHGLDRTDRSKWRLQLRWYTTDGDHEYASCVELEWSDPKWRATVDMAFNLLLQAHVNVEKLKEQGKVLTPTGG